MPRIYRKPAPFGATAFYFATTATQSKTTTKTVVCVVSVPSCFSPFRQQLEALRHAKEMHPHEGIVGVVERGKLPTRVQIAAQKACPLYQVRGSNER